jgi:hypothetical protein
VSSHQDLHLAIAQYHQSLVDKDSKKFGDYIARLRVCNHLCWQNEDKRFTAVVSIFRLHLCG